MPSVASRAANAFLDLFRSKPLFIPPDLTKRPELTAADYRSNREMYPIYTLAGWDPERIIQMLEQHDIGNFVSSELFYQALRKEGLISAALAMRRESALEYASTLQCPKEAPPEMHAYVKSLSRNWQTVLPDAVRGECIERTNVFGFAVCRIQWTWESGQRQPIFHPWTHSSLQYRTDLSSPDNPVYQGLSEDRGVEYINNDGREWVVFSLGGTRPWLGGMLRSLAFVYFGIITGDDRWLNFNDKFAEPIRIQYTPRLMRESAEAQRLYEKVEWMRGGDLHVQPREEKDKGYDFRYEQVDAQGFETLKEQLERFDMRAAIIILGHNLLQQVKGGSLAAMKEAKGLLRTKSVTDLRNCSSACEPLSKVWARANFGTDPSDFPELGGRLPEQVTWSLIYDTTDPELKELAAARAGKYADAYDKFFKALAEASEVHGSDSGSNDDKAEELAFGKDATDKQPGVVAPAPEKPSPAFVRALIRSIDWHEAAERCGLPMKGGEESYSQDDDDEAELGAGWTRPRKLLGAGRAALLAAKPKAKLLDGRFRIGPHGRSQRLKDLTGIASVAVFDPLGRLLMGKRRDSGKWTMPGGHLEPGEGAAAGAARELFEEAGLAVPELEHIGSGTPGRGLLVHCFRCQTGCAPDSSADPDEEVERWEWHELPLPAVVIANLHAPRNVTLALLGRPVGEVVIYERARVAGLLSAVS